MSLNLVEMDPYAFAKLSLVYSSKLDPLRLEALRYYAPGAERV